MSGGWSGGVFSISADMSANELAGIPILSRPFSDQRDEIIAGINNCLTKDGQNAATADLPMGARKHTNVARAVAVTNYLRANEYIHDTPRYMVDQEAAATASISCSVEYWPVSASAGMTARIRMAGTKPRTDRTEVEVVINGVTVSATDNRGAPLMPGALVSGGVYDFVYDGSKFRCMNPSVSIKKYLVVARAFDTGPTPVTISTGATLTVLAAVNGDVGFIHVGAETSPRVMTFQKSTAVAIYLSVPSGFATGDVSDGGIVHCLTSSSTQRLFATELALTDIVIRNKLVTTAFGSSFTFMPFHFSYPIRRTVDE